MCFFPFLIIPIKIRKQAGYQIFVLLYTCKSQNRIGCPKAVASGFSSSFKPEIGITFHIPLVVQPSSFVKMMTSRATNGIVFSGPGYIRKKFGDYKPRGSFFNVLTECPPPEIIGFFEFLIGTIKIGNVFLQKFICLGIWIILHIYFIIITIEIRNIRTVILPL